MKKCLIIIALVVGAFAVPGNAQELSLGGGLAYGSNIQNPGINLRGDVRFLDLWSVSPNFNMFFNKKDGAITREWQDLNIDAHLYFKLDKRWNLYPLVGINFATVSEKEDNLTFTKSGAGANLGIGSEVRIDKYLSGFGEAKYQSGEVTQAVVTFGLIYKVTQ